MSTDKVIKVLSLRNRNVQVTSPKKSKRVKQSEVEVKQVTEVKQATKVEVEVKPQYEISFDIRDIKTKKIVYSNTVDVRFITPEKRFVPEGKKRKVWVVGEKINKPDCKAKMKQKESKFEPDFGCFPGGEFEFILE